MCSIARKKLVSIRGSCEHTVAAHICLMESPDCSTVMFLVYLERCNACRTIDPMLCVAFHLDIMSLACHLD